MKKIKKYFSATQVIAISFLITIIIGSLLFMLPVSHSRTLSYRDALFTAVSATCVTGHSTIDAASDLTTFGQVVLMLLIQIRWIAASFWLLHLFCFFWAKKYPWKIVY